ncbi:MAG: tryptophan 7-halogenase, partial [Pirellulaceae bacterium]
VDGDLFVDCSGFAAELIGKRLDEEFIEFSSALFCDRAVVGGWQRTHEIYHPFTTAETMNAGWCWRIEHDELINRGYVFCSKFLTDEEAVEEYQHANPLAEVAKVIGFRAGVRRRSWVGNVVAVGNATGFVEPLEATAIGMICDATVRLVRCLQASGGRILDEQQRIFNRITLDNWLIIRDFLALHYKYNSRLDTPFWQAAREDVDIGAASQFVDYYRCVGPDFSVLDWEMKRDFFTSEGYLVMLLGQQVPFDRPVQISPDDLDVWNQLKTKLSAMAAGGLNVPEFLQLARSPDAASRFAQRSGRGATGMTRIGEGFRMGELNWH